MIHPRSAYPLLISEFDKEIAELEKKQDKIEEQLKELYEKQKLEKAIKVGEHYDKNYFSCGSSKIKVIKLYKNKSPLVDLVRADNNKVMIMKEGELDIDLMSLLLSDSNKKEFIEKIKEAKKILNNLELKYTKKESGK